MQPLNAHNESECVCVGGVGAGGRLVRLSQKETAKYM